MSDSAEALDERAFQAFWAWTNHPSEAFARQAWQRMVDGTPAVTTPGQETGARAPDVHSLAAWRRVAQRLA